MLLLAGVCAGVFLFSLLKTVHSERGRSKDGLRDLCRGLGCLGMGEGWETRPRLLHGQTVGFAS